MASVCEPLAFEFEAKGMRAVSRRRNIDVRQEEYARAQSAPRRPSAPPAETRVKTHRLARAAARSLIAKNVVEGGADMPSIISSKGRVFSRSASKKKPSVARVTNWQVSGVEDYETIPYVKSASTSVEDYETIPHVKSAIEDTWKGSVDSEGETTATEGSQSEAEEPTATEGSQSEAEEPPASLEESPAEEVATGTAEAAEEQKDVQVAVRQQADYVPEEASSKREKVLRGLVEHLRAQREQERQRALEAEVKKAELEQRISAEESGRPPAPTKGAQRKAALQAEKKVAAEMRKRRQQEDQLRSLKERSQLALKEASRTRTRDEAEAEAISVKVQHLAHAQVEARFLAEAFAQEEAAKVKAELEEYTQCRMDELVKVEAELKANIVIEAEAVKATAESEARHTREQAENLKAKAESEIQSLKTRTQIECRVIKARAEMEVRDLKASIEVDRMAKFEYEAQEAAAKAQAAKEAERRAQAAAQREVAAGLKEAKEAERQRANQFHRKSEQDRKLEEARGREVEAARAKLEEEGQALRAKALAEASELKARAQAEAEHIRAKAVAEAQELAEDRARAAKAEAQAFAAQIRAEARAQARALREAVVKREVVVAAEREGAEEQADNSWEVLFGGGSAQEEYVVRATDTDEIAAVDGVADDWSILDL